MRILVIGGAGFVGSNLTEHYLAQGHEVASFDNLSRPGGGAERNIGHLIGRYGGSRFFQFIFGDVRDLGQVLKAMRKADVVFHVAAQTAMSTSLDDPIDDFGVNATGTLNVLEAARILGNNPVIFYTSTNKVFGELTNKPVRLAEMPTRWTFADSEYQDGINENYPLDYEGPYGCSKGIGDAYCIDYARTFGLRTVVFRMSGIYGVGQHPTEDQGWVAWFLRRASEKKPVTIFGDGKQVRDILYITDLLDAFDKVLENIHVAKGQAYNIGGGKTNSISVIELLNFLEENLGIKPSEINYGPWRRADQKIYISNTAKAMRDFNWQPRISKEEGIKKLYYWMQSLT